MTPEDLALKIREVLLREGKISEASAAKSIGMNQQNFNTKLNKGTLRYLEVNALMESLGYEIVWQKRI